MKTQLVILIINPHLSNKRMAFNNNSKRLRFNSKIIIIISIVITINKVPATKKKMRTLNNNKMEVINHQIKNSLK